MKVRVDSLAWIAKADLTVSQLQALKQRLTIVPKKYGDSDDEGPDVPICLYKETEAEIGVAREFFLQNKSPQSEIVLDVSEGDKSTWPGDLEFAGTLRPEQETARLAIEGAFHRGSLGGLLKAEGGWGKTVWACSLIASLQMPTLVIVHKTFLLNQWKERLQQFLPEAKIGVAQQNKCDFRGKHIVIGMVHSLAKDRYPEEFRRWPGLIIVDEVHRISARTWSGVPTIFKAKHIVGVSGTPRRKDGTENVFFHHIGPVLFEAREQRLKPTIKRVHSSFRMVQTDRFNPKLAPESLILTFLCANQARNQKIVELMVEALRSGRKLLVLSKRLNHLERLEAMLRREWRELGLGNALSTGFYVGGMSEEALYKSSQARVIFGTTQFCSEGLDIPSIDTLFLTNPVGDAEQMIWRICRPYEGKKSPIVVDVRDDSIPLFKGYAHARERLYSSKGWS